MKLLIMAVYTHLMYFAVINGLLINLVRNSNLTGAEQKIWRRDVFACFELQGVLSARFFEMS